MSIIVMPNDLYISEANVEQVRFDMEEASEPTGATAARLFGPPKWKLRIGCDSNATFDQADQWEGMIIPLRGRVNALAAYDAGRRVPRGTMRGALTISSTISPTNIVLAGAVGTLKVGDWLQLGSGIGTSMLIKVMAPVTAAAGLANVTFEPPLRMSFSAGTTVTWDHARGYYRAINPTQGWSYTANSRLQGGFSTELLETFN